jgi:hypothetical protein
MAKEPPEPGVPSYDLPEAALGGADAVPDTNYVPPPEPGPEHPKGEGPVGAAVPAGSGNGTTWAIIAFLLIAAVLVFFLGFGR